MSVITLTPSEILQGAMVGVMRQTKGIEKGRRHAHNSDQEATKDWQQHVEGALGEMALAKYLGVYWSNGFLGACDVAGSDVRQTDRQNGCLLLHQRDEDSRPFFLVTGKCGTYTIRGWLYAKDGKVDQYWKDPVGGRAAYFVPQSKLNPPHLFQSKTEETL